MSQPAQQHSVEAILEENARLREHLGRYVELFGPLPSESATASPLLNTTEIIIPPVVGVPQHQLSAGATAGSGASTLILPDFSQDGTSLDPALIRFPNPYAMSPAGSPAHLVQQNNKKKVVGAHHARSTSALPPGAPEPADTEVPTYPLRPSFSEAGPAARRDALSTDPHVNTTLVIFDGFSKDPYHASGPPVYLTSTFKQPSITEFQAYDYSRSGNPGRAAVETLISKLEGSDASFCFATGMAAIASIISMLHPGERVIACADIYGGAHRLLMYQAQHANIVVDFVDTSDIDNLRASLNDPERPPCKLVHVESPSNPLMRITDLAAVAKLAHEHGALVSVDCTMMTPLRQQPLALGCDLVMHSATKFFGGHADCMAGVVSCSTPELSKKIAFVSNAFGTALSAFDCFLIQRGLKTLAIRLERAEVNAVAIAQYLVTQKKFVKKLYYSGIEPHGQRPGGCSSTNVAAAAASSSADLLRTASQAAHSCDVTDVLATTQEQYDLHWRQSTGPTTVMSFEVVGGVKVARKFVDACKLFKLTVSFGSVSSLVEMPCALSHASIRSDMRTLPEDLVRLSIGIEHVHDLLADLANAMKVAMAEEEK